MSYNLIDKLNILKKLVKSKSSKSDAGYVLDRSVSNPTGPYLCKTCKHFMPPIECATVGLKSETIYYNGCCNYWDNDKAVFSK